MDIKYKNLTKAEVKYLKDYNVDDEVIQSINAIQRKRHGADRFCADTYVDTYVGFFSKLNQKYNISISKFEKLYDVVINLDYEYFGANSPGLELSQIKHEIMEFRLFMS